MKRGLKVLLAVLLALGVVCAAGFVSAEGVTDGLRCDTDGVWRLYLNGEYAGGYTGLYCDANVGWWLIGGGTIAWDYTGLWNDPNCGWWLIGSGSVCFDYNGVWDDPNLGPWMISGGRPVEPAAPAFADGLHDDGNGWHLYLNGEVASWYNGLYCDANVGWWLVENGAVSFGYNGLYCDANFGWWLVQNGAVNFGYTGLYCDANVGWWLIGGGSVCFDYNGVWNDPNLGPWVVSGGRPVEPAVQANGLVCGADGVWRLYLNGEFASGYTGLYGDATYGWWLINSGTVDAGYTGLYNDANVGWWLIQGGTIAWNYTGPWNDPVYGEYNIQAGHMEEKKKEEGTDPTGKPIRIGIIALDPAESGYREKNVKDLQETFIAENGYEAFFAIAPDPSNQINAAQNFIANNMDYLLICAALPTGWDNVLQQAKNAGIGVILYDRLIDVDPSLYTAAVLSDMAKEGEAAVSLLESLKLKEYKILHIQGMYGSSAQIGRTSGLEAKCNTASNWSIVQQGCGNWSASDAYTITQAAIKAGADFNIIYAENDSMAQGAADALDEAGITHGVSGDVIIIGFDSNKFALRKLLAGEWNFDVQCSPFQATPIDQMIKTLEKGGTIQGLDTQKIYINPDIGFDARTITEADVEKYGLGD